METTIFCSTCKIAIAKKIIQKICLKTGLNFPEIPIYVKDSTLIEESLIMARLPFMKSRPLGYHGQSLLKGGIVNTPIPVNNIVTSLPRSSIKLM